MKHYMEFIRHYPWLHGINWKGRFAENKLVKASSDLLPIRWFSFEKIFVEKQAFARLGEKQTLQSLSDRQQNERDEQLKEAPDTFHLETFHLGPEW